MEPVQQIDIVSWLFLKDKDSVLEWELQWNRERHAEEKEEKKRIKDKMNKER